jgi:hypothetical protein
MKYWDTKSCIDTFINHPTYRFLNGRKFIADPETNNEINPGFIDRIKLYNESLDILGKDFYIAPKKIKEIFNRYLRSTNEITKIEKLILRSFLFLEDIDIISNFKESGFELRNKVEEFLSTKPNGSWLFRKSSIIDTTIVNAKVLSLVSFYNDVPVFDHILCLHVKGYGYYSPSKIKQNQEMPDFNNKVELPPTNTPVYPCFLDWFETCIKYINTQRFIKYKQEKSIWKQIKLYIMNIFYQSYNIFLILLLSILVDNIFN